MCFKVYAASNVGYFLFFFFNDTATTEIYTLSLHDALPISAARTAAVSTTGASRASAELCRRRGWPREAQRLYLAGDRKSTRLNSSHSQISYAVFCLKKKKIHTRMQSLLTSLQVLLRISSPV